MPPHAIHPRLIRVTPDRSPLLPSLVSPDGVPQSETGPNVGHKGAEVLPGRCDQVLNAAQPGTFDQPLLVEHPFASGGQAALGCSQHSLAEVGQAGDPVPAPGVDSREVQRARGEPEPGNRRCLSQLRREPRARQVTPWPRSTAWRAYSRPSHAVPPRIKISITALKYRLRRRTPAYARSALRRQRNVPGRHRDPGGL